MSRILTIEIPDSMTTEQVAEALKRQTRWSAPAPEPAPAPAPSSGSAPEAELLLTPAEAATMWKVNPKTITRWAKAGKLSSIRTLGGHRRYRANEIRALLSQPGDPVA